MWFFLLLTWLGIIVLLLFFILSLGMFFSIFLLLFVKKFEIFCSIATGLYYLAELIEEYTTVSCKIIRQLNLVKKLFNYSF